MAQGDHNRRSPARFDPLTDAADIVLRVIGAYTTAADRASLKEVVSDRDSARAVDLTREDLEEGMRFLKRLGLLEDVRPDVLK